MDDNDETLSYKAQLSNGNALPEGLVMDASTGIISGSSSQLGKYSTNMTVTDQKDKSVASSFTSKIVSVLGLTSPSIAKVECFPNPTEHQLQLTLPEGLTSYRYSITSSSGQLLHSKEKTASFIDVSHLPQGVYIIDFWLDNSHLQ